MNLEKLYEPVEYVVNMGGKNTRSLFIKYIQHIINNNNNPNTKLFIKDINDFHNASLVIDDIQDESLKRRGQPCVHLVYGTPLTLNSGYLKCFDLLESIDTRYPANISKEVKNACISALKNIHIGQGLDLLWAKNKQIVPIDDYFYMIDNKTGILFHLICQLCLISKGNNKYMNDIFNMAKCFGRFFQIRDDYINLTKPSYWNIKGFCEDFDEKKSSYIFVKLNQITKNNNIFEHLCKYEKLTQENKIDFYNLLYQNKVLHEVYFDLEKYKQEIIDIEKKITNSENPSEFLKMFFKKLDYNLPIEPKNIKKCLMFL